jgi:hypothetical protein
VIGAGGILLQTVEDAGLPVLVFVAVIITGIELTAVDFRCIALKPGTFRLVARHRLASPRLNQP